MAVVASDLDFSYRVDVARGVTLKEPIPALKGITLNIPRGGRCAVLGANGAGKSTLLRLLAGRHTPDNGLASVLGEPCRSPRLNGKVAYVPAESWGSGLASLSVQSVVEGARGRSLQQGGTDTALDALEAATGVGKLKSRDTSALSDGQRRAVQLFVALAPPKLELILLDEACADLDALVRDRVLAYVRALNVTVLYATHVFDGLDDWPTQICDVRNGSVHACEAWSLNEPGSLFASAKQRLEASEPAHLKAAAEGALAGNDQLKPLGGDAVAFDAVTWRYDPRARPALDDCSLRLKAGRIVVVGENGAGKSTLLALAAGARLAVSAAISIHGAHPSLKNLRAPGAAPRVAYLGPAFKASLESCLAVSKATLFGDTLQGAARGDPEFPERAKRLMALLGVEEGWRSGLCSSGQKTRLQLVLQLAPRADVRILDELTRDLDALARHRVLEFLKCDSPTCLYATHVFQGLDGWATDVLRVRRGKGAVEAAPLVGVAAVLLAGLRSDDDAGDADLPPPPAPLAVAPTVDAPVGWASRRANTLEGGYGAHGWTTESAVGAQHASEHSTAHKAFADLYESAGPGSSGGKR